MKYTSCFTAFLTLILCINANADIHLSGNLTNPNSYGNRVFVSDLATDQANFRVYDDFSLNDTVVRRVEWLGSAIPNMAEINPVFSLSFHEQLRDENASWGLRNYPNVSPFASYEVEPEIVSTSAGASGNRWLYSAVLPEELVIVGYQGPIWVSVALVTPRIDNFAWELGEANALGVSFRLDINGGELAVRGTDLALSFWGVYYAPEELDSDGDGIYDQYDLCPNTQSIEGMDVDGCADYERDSDGDGYTDDIDICPVTMVGDKVDFRGCSAVQVDTDNDGVADAYDACVSSPRVEIVNLDGCTSMQLTEGSHLYSQVFDNRYFSTGFNVFEVVSDGNLPSKVYDDFYVARTTNIDQVSWVGSALIDSELGENAHFRVTFHIAVPEAPTIPFVTEMKSFVVNASQSDFIDIFSNGEAKDAQVFTANLPESYRAAPLQRHFVSIEYIGNSNSGDEENWLWFGNANLGNWASTPDPDAITPSSYLESPITDPSVSAGGLFFSLSTRETLF